MQQCPQHFWPSLSSCTRSHAVMRAGVPALHSASGPTIQFPYTLTLFSRAETFKRTVALRAQPSNSHTLSGCPPALNHSGAPWRFWPNHPIPIHSHAVLLRAGIPARHFPSGLESLNLIMLSRCPAFAGVPARHSARCGAGAAGGGGGPRAGHGVRLGGTGHAGSPGGGRLCGRMRPARAHLRRGTQGAWSSLV